MFLRHDLGWMLRCHFFMASLPPGISLEVPWVPFSQGAFGFSLDLMSWRDDCK